MNRLSGDVIDRLRALGDWLAAEKAESYCSAGKVVGSMWRGLVVVTGVWSQEVVEEVEELGRQLLAPCYVSVGNSV